jgi:hypothetical protein
MGEREEEQEQGSEKGVNKSVYARVSRIQTANVKEKIRQSVIL